jgi:nicotinamidase/pyrazinamidase
MRTFVIVVDAQKDFMLKTGALPVPGAEEIIHTTNDFLRNLNPDEVEGVLYTFDTHNSEVYATSPEGQMFPEHCVEGTEGWNLAVVTTIPNGIPVYHLKKGVFNMWEEPNLKVVQVNGGRYDDILSIDREEFFEELKARGVKKLKIISVASDFCVKWAIEGALARGFEIEVVRRLTAGIYRQIDQVVAEDFVGQPVKVI